MSSALANPVDFVRLCQFLFGKNFVGPAVQIARSVAEHRSTAVAGCHASGKTWSAARIGVANLFTSPKAITLTTAPTFPQVERVIWGEIHAAYEEMRENGVDVGSLPPIYRTEWRWTANNYLYGFSTDRSVRLQGYHGDILIIIEEATGVRDELYEAIEGIRSGGNVRVLALANPTIIGGKFYDAFHDDRFIWASMNISAFDLPNFKHPTEDRQITEAELLAMDADQLHDNPFPFLANKWWAREKYEQWGPTSPMYVSRVLGRFPSQTEDSLFNLNWIEAANRPPELSGGPLTAGIDVAGPGEDQTVITVCDGGAILEQRGWDDADSRALVLEKLAVHGGPERFESVNVDTVGIGYNFALHLKDAGYPVKFVNAGAKPRDQKKFVNVKAEMYWGLRQKLQDGDISGLTSEITRAQLGTVRYSHNAAGKIEIESKQEARDRGVKSPDHAESFVIAQLATYALPGTPLAAARPPDVLDSLRTEDFMDVSRW